MRAPYLAALMAAGAVASVLPRQESGDNPETGPAPLNNIGVFNTHDWPLLQPEQALSALHEKARATPTAVSPLPGVPIPSDIAQLLKGVENIAQSMTEGAVGNIAQSITEGMLEHITQPQQEGTQTGGASTGSGAGKVEQANAEQPKTEQPKAEQSKVEQSKQESKVQDASDAAASTCTNPQVHYEWRNLSDEHKGQFVAAIKCLMGKPARSGLPGTKTRWDDLGAIHQHMSPTIHNVGQFLPWHRYFMKIFEQELRTVCGYAGPMTWWDETKDAGNFNGAPMFTQQYFGHMPDGNTVCIISGQYANLQLRIGPGQGNTNHCLSRGCNEQLSSSITMDFVNTCNSYNGYEDMNNCQFFGVHGYGHDAIGGVMSDVDSSPGDPAFFLHHGFVDRNWRIWQRTDPGPRTNAIGGYTTQNCGNNCQPTTLNYVLSSLNFYPSVTVGTVMNTEGNYLCYKYDY